MRENESCPVKGLVGEPGCLRSDGPRNVSENQGSLLEGEDGMVEAAERAGDRTNRYDAATIVVCGTAPLCC